MKKKVLEFLRKLTIQDYTLILLFCLYAVLMMYRFATFNYDANFGYADHQVNWQSVTEFLRGQVLYKDFVWEYGLLNILFKIPFFLLFGQSFFGSVFTFVIVLPLIGIVLSYFLAKEVLKGWQMVAFMTLLLLYEANNYASSYRYLLPQLGLMLTMVGLEMRNRKKTRIGAVLLGLTVLSSTEYIVATLACILVYLVVQLLRKKITISQITPVVGIGLFFGGILLGYLGLNGAIGNYIQYHLDLGASFFTYSPCTDVFPRFYNFSSIPQSGGASAIMYRLNYYIVPAFILLLTVWLFLQKKLLYRTIFLILMGFAAIAYIRIIATPCHIPYVITGPFLILCFFLFQKKLNPIIQWMMIAIVVWFAFSGGQLMIKQFFVHPDKTTDESVYFKEEGIYLPKKIVAAYRETTEYILRNSKPDDYIFVYPNGPYYNLTGRRNAIDLISIVHYQFIPYLYERSYQKLVERKPALVIINRHNGPHYRNSVRGIRYNVLAQGTTITFDGEVTKIEDYIGRWYELDKITDVAWVLKRREKPIDYIPFYVELPPGTVWNLQTTGVTNNPPLEPTVSQFAVTNEKPLIIYHAENVAHANLVRIPIKYDYTFPMLRKYGLFTFIITDKGQPINLGGAFIDTSWQDQWILLPDQEIIPEGMAFTGVAVQLSNNEGFLPGGRPTTIEIKPPKIYKKNPAFTVEKVAMNEKQD